MMLIWLKGCLQRHLSFNPWLQVTAALLLLIAFSGWYEPQGLKFLTDVNKNSTEVLLFTGEIKQIIASLEGIDIPFVQGSIQQVVHSFNKAENLMMLSSLVIAFQLILFELSRITAIKMLALIFFAGTFLAKTNKLSTKLLILILAINPGLILFSAATQHLSESVGQGFNDGLHTRLALIADGLRTEKAQLMTAHEADLKHIKKDDKGFKFFRRLASDVMYDLSDAKSEIKGDIKEIRTIFKIGGKDLIKSVMERVAHSLFFMLHLPLAYACFIYLLFQHLMIAVHKKEEEQIR